MLVGNKSDLASERYLTPLSACPSLIGCCSVISNKEAQEFAKELGLPYLETSAEVDVVCYHAKLLAPLSHVCARMWIRSSIQSLRRLRLDMATASGRRNHLASSASLMIVLITNLFDPPSSFESDKCVDWKHRIIS